MFTNQQLHTIMPQLPAAKGATLFPFLAAAVAEFAIEEAPRAAAFLAQLAHESAQFRFMEELWGPTAAQRRYEPPGKLAADLGNTEAGDGQRFKGRGPIQITGRANYRRFGDLLGLDLIADPSQAALPEVAFRIAALFWSKNGLNELADKITPEAFREITKRINGGFTGLAERERFYETAKTVLGVMGPTLTRGVARAPVDTEEPVFARGFEAIRTGAARRVSRTAAKPTGKKRSLKRASRKKPTKGARKAHAKKSVRKRTVSTRTSRASRG
jgi:putative chitinase